MARLSFSFIGKKRKEDTGLRGTFGGRLYVDKKVFYKRTEVKNAFLKIKNSKSIKRQLEEQKVAI